jgi:hypothetical protein
MSHILFELLENSVVIKGTEINTERIARLKRSELAEIALQSVEMTAASSLSSAGSIFSHTASMSLSGAPFPCAGIECRLKKAAQLVQFAAFYSDRVFMNNGLFSSLGISREGDLDDARFAFYNELRVLMVFRPLIQSGLIVPLTPSTTKCLHCLGKSVLPAREVARFDRALSRMKRRFADEVEVGLEWSKHEPVIVRCLGKDDLIEHGYSATELGDIAAFSRDHPALASRLRKNGEILLSQTARKELGIDAENAHSLFNEVGFEMGVSQCLKSSVVTSRPIDVEILKDLVHTDELNRRNALIQKHLTCIVPFLDKISPNEILDLRRAEADSFISFRQALAKAVDEYIKAKAGELTERVAEAIYREVIEPDLARLNQRVRSASKSLFRKSRAGMLGWAAAISAGFYFGLAESSLLVAAKAFGLTKVVTDLIGSSAKDAIRNESMYFLWRVRHYAERG